ncbi:type I restriction enzyme HsdR N-terminal domain-containing protein [Peijinzhouia sedimentorum]
MIKLNLPEVDCKIKKEEEKVLIFDRIRKKYLTLTPEEWVRQHLLAFFIDHLKYPKGLISVESGLRYNKQAKRSDILVHNKAGGYFLLCECKAPSVRIDENTLHQAMVYAKTLNPDFLVLSNGLTHFVFGKESESQRWQAIEIFPAHIN